MKRPLSPLVKRLLVLPPIVVGVIVLVLLTWNRSEPQRAPEKEVSHALRVIDAPLVDVLPRTLGHGTAQPSKIWPAVVEVKGRVTEVHPDLQAGAVLKKGSTVLKVDSTEYDLVVARLVAEISQEEAQLAELRIRRQNDLAALKIEAASLQLAERELGRQRELLKTNAAAASAVEQQERLVLTQRQSVQAINNSLNLYPSSEQAATAKINVKKAQHEQAKLDVKKTLIQAPFTCRVGPVSIELNQFLAAGEKLFEAHSIESIEVEAQVSPQFMDQLLHRPPSGAPLTIDMQTVRDIFKIDGVVRFGPFSRRVEWPAHFVSVREKLDANTRTLGVVFAIANPYTKAIPGIRPPPVQGTYCEVELRAQKRLRHIVVPRAAVSDSHVYVLDAERRLRRRRLTIAFSQSSFIAVSAGLEPGETVVVSEPTAAVDGMLVSPITDQRLHDELVADAMGRGELR